MKRMLGEQNNGEVEENVEGKEVENEKPKLDSLGRSTLPEKEKMLLPEFWSIRATARSWLIKSRSINTLLGLPFK